MVHQYQLNGYNIVLDTCSGSVHVVDDVAYDVIAMYKEHSADEIVAALLAKYGSRPDVTEADLRQCLEDVASLESAGKLWAPDVYENMAFDFKNRQTVVKALCLHVAHTCNLNCSYCFASQGRYQGDRALMSFEVGKRAMDFLIENSGTRRNLEVDFFGGEPLMNFDMVKKLVAYCREQEKIHNKNFRFTMTTNGVLIDDDVIDFCNKECHNVVLSLDGRKEVHDRFRKDYAGHGSYDAIVPKFQEFVKKRGDKNYYMRGTYTHYNTDFTNDIFHMADLGFTELSMEPVVSKPTDPSALTAEDLPILKEQYEILAKEMIKRDREGRGFTFYHYMIDLTGGPCIYKRISGCGSGTVLLVLGKFMFFHNHICGINRLSILVLIAASADASTDHNPHSLVKIFLCKLCTLAKCYAGNKICFLFSFTFISSVHCQSISGYCHIIIFPGILDLRILCQSSH